MDDTEKWHAWIVFESGRELAVIRADLRTKGLSETAYVFVVADASDPASRFFLEQIHPSFEAVDKGFVGAVPTADALRVLRLISSSPTAALLETQPRLPGTIRVLTMARGRANFCDIDPDLPPSGFNASGGKA